MISGPISSDLLEGCCQVLHIWHRALQRYVVMTQASIPYPLKGAMINNCQATFYGITTN